MVEESTSPQTSPEAPVAKAPEAAPKKDSKFVSWGQFGKHWATYFGVDWFFNAACGVGFAYVSKFTKIGQTLWSGWVQKSWKWLLSKPVFSKIFKDDESLAYGVDVGATFNDIIIGGMTTIPVLKFLEKPSVNIGVTRWLDEKIYGKEAVANDPKFEASYEVMANAPPKDTWAGITSRFAALAPLLAWVLPKGNDFRGFKTILEFRKTYFDDWIGSFSQKCWRKLGFSEASFKDGTKMENGELIKASAADKWNYVHNNAFALDFGLGWPYAILHSFFYNMFSGWRGKPPEPATAPATAKTTATPEATPQTASVKPAPSAKVSADAASHDRVDNIAELRLAHA
jgi:hypothetical protein